jgi:diguanylate cyclase (GGDEF)-like protein
VESPLLVSLVTGVVVAGVGLLLHRARSRAAERTFQARQEDAARQHAVLVRDEQALKDQLAAANDALRLRAARLQEVLRASMELKAHLPLEAVLANVARAASACFGCGQVLLSLHDRAEGVLVPRAHVGLSEAWPRLERVRLPSDRMAAARPSEGAAGVSLLLAGPAEGLRGPVVTVPLVAGGQEVGLLELAGPRPGGDGIAEDRVVLELFASHAVNAIRLARAHETTRLGSLRDPLTGVANHGHFQETLARELTRHGRSGERLVLLIADLDEFKAVNDRHGHPVGDAVLKGFVARVLATVREMDTVARYGGEEFAVVLPQTDATAGMGVAERIRGTVASAPIPAGLAGELPLTVSIGVAVYPEDATTKGGLVDCADKALYAAKKTGRNRVVRFTRLPALAEALLTERT